MKKMIAALVVPVSWTLAAAVILVDRIMSPDLSDLPEWDDGDTAVPGLSYAACPR